MASIGMRVLLVAAPLALLAPACGSSTSSSGGRPDASTSPGDASMTASGSGSGTGSGSGSESGSGRGSGTASGTGSGSGTASGSGSGSGTASGTGSSSGSGTGSGSGSGTGSGSGSHPDAGKPVDSGADSGAWSVGSGPSNPGYVTCGSTQCDLTTTVCCLSTAGGPSCVAAGGGQCPGVWTIACDEPEDCPTGEFCGIGTNDPLGTRCTTSAGWPRVCKKNADCGDAGGGVCVMNQACDGYRVYVSTCGVDQWCAEFP